MLAIKRRGKKSFFFHQIFFFFLHIPSSYANILGETNFQSREIPESGSKAKDGEKKEREREREERLNDGNNNGQLRIATPPQVAHTKPPGPTSWG